MDGLIDAAPSEAVQAIMAALRACYGNLDEPDFRKVHETLRKNPYRAVIESLRSSGIAVTDTTDPNDDVATRLVLDRSGDQVGLALSGVGPFAALTHQDSDEHYSWVTRSEEAPSPLAGAVAETVRRAGFELLSRGIVNQSVAMSWYDGATKVTLYQALFSDSDKIP